MWKDHLIMGIVLWSVFIQKIPTIELFNPLFFKNIIQPQCGTPSMYVHNAVITVIQIKLLRKKFCKNILLFSQHFSSFRTEHRRTQTINIYTFISRAVQKNIFSSKFNPIVFISWFMGLIACTKKFSPKVFHLTPLRAFLSLHRSVLALRSVLPSSRAARARNRAILV